MISKELYEAVSDLHKPSHRSDIKRQVYYDINRNLKNIKKGKVYIDIYHANPSILIEVNSELLNEGYYSMVINDINNPFLRIYLRDV